MPWLVPRRTVVLVSAAVAAGVVVLIVVLGVFVYGAFSLPGLESTVAYNGARYYHTPVDVPSTSNSTEPLRVSFHDATFLLWWPPPLPEGTPSTGVFGVNVTIYEAGGPADHLFTDCAACGDFPVSAFSPDQQVGIAWTADPGELGNVTLLVEAPSGP